MTGQALLSLTRADECARAVLMDSYDADVAGQIVRGLPDVLRSAAAVWDEIPTDQQPGDIATGTPLATAAMIAAHLEQGDRCKVAQQPVAEKDNIPGHQGVQNRGAAHNAHA